MLFSAAMEGMCEGTQSDQMYSSGYSISAAVTEVLLYVLRCVMQSGGLTKHCDGTMKGFTETIYIKLK